MSLAAVFLLSACQRRTDDTSRVDGSLIFASACARCHGADGCGGMAMNMASKARNFCDPNFQALISDAQIKQTVSKGQGMMPAFGDEYNDEQLSALVRHIRTLKSGSAHAP